MVNTHQCEIDTLPKINYQANSKKIIDALLFKKKIPTLQLFCFNKCSLLKKKLIL